MLCCPYIQKQRCRLFGYVGNYPHGVPFQTSWIEVCAVFCKKPWFINNAIIINLHSLESRIRQHSFFFKATLDWNWHLSANVEPLKAHRPLSGFVFVFLKSSQQVTVVKWSWVVVAGCTAQHRGSIEAFSPSSLTFDTRWWIFECRALRNKGVAQKKWKAPNLLCFKYNLMPRYKVATLIERKLSINYYRSCRHW